jgi:hypothetical protein
VFIKNKNFWASLHIEGRKPIANGFYLKIEGHEWISTINFIKLLYQLFKPFYLHAGEQNTCRIYTPGYSAVQCLGGMCWLNIFSKPYIDMWGRKKLENAPDCKVEWLEDGSVMILMVESPLEEEDITQKAEEKLKQYLGEESFFRDDDKKKSFTPAEFKEYILHKPPRKKYKVPDFSQYYDYSPEAENRKFASFIQDLEKGGKK